MAYSNHDIEQMDLVDNQIFELIQQLNPTEKEIDWDIGHISKIREALIQIYVHDLQICTEEEFYP
jgi:DNA polymerase sigma